VLVRTLAVGFVPVGQAAKIKIATYPFQKYGILDGVVVHVSPDASETPAPRRDNAEDDAGGLPAPNGYRARVALASQSLAFDTRPLLLTSGMQVEAEIRLGDRSLIEYVLAPFQKAWHEAARER
jgi:HlyD family secretion protein